jgi:hypothetical protein
MSSSEKVVSPECGASGRGVMIRLSRAKRPAAIFSQPAGDFQDEIGFGRLDGPLLNEQARRLRRSLE